MRNVITKGLIAKAFKMAGLYPVDCTIFKDSDFAPSQASLSNVHAPPLFPVEFPSSDADDRSYMPSDDEDTTSLSDLETSKDDLDERAILEQNSQGNLKEMQAEDVLGQEADSGAHATDKGQLEDPVLGCAVALDNLEREIIYMTRSMATQFE